jgi:heme exporter protein C
MTMSSTTDRRSERLLAVSAAVTGALMVLALVGIFLVAPEDADQGIIQKIFYFHVAVAIAAMIAFLVACVAAILYLRARQERYDEISSISVGIGLAFSVLVVITGSIWAKASWGTYWVWDDPRLVTFLIVLLLYAVRIARSFVHPVVFTNSGANMPNSMLIWFGVSLAAFIALFVTILQFELIQRRTEKALRRMKLQIEGD